MEEEEIQQKCDKNVQIKKDIKSKNKKKVEIKLKKKKIIIAMCIFAIIIIGLIISIIVKVTTKTSTEVANQDNLEAPQEEDVPFIVDIEDEDTNTDDENKESEENNNANNVTAIDVKYYIKVNNEANVVTIYQKDSNGNYTVPVKAMICSIGSATPTGGVYTIPGGKWDRWTWGQMVGNVWAQYYTRIKGSILFHSVPYTAQDKSTLEYWEYDKLGTKASAGCIRLTVEDAKWIYDNCKPGTQVEFYYDSNPGPLGKPVARKISGEASYVRGWDPTDPSAENPWKNYTGNSNQQTEDNEDKNNDLTNNTSTVEESTTTPNVTPTITPSTTPEPTLSTSPSTTPEPTPSTSPSTTPEPTPESTVTPTPDIILETTQNDNQYI